MKLGNIFTALALIAFCSLGAFAQSAKGSGTQAVRDVDQPARQPFYGYVLTNNGNIGQITVVPAGKVLVIEFVTGQMSTTGNRGRLNLAIRNSEGNTEAVHIFAASYFDTVSNVTDFTHQARIYVPAGYAVEAVPGTTGVTYMSATASGYYVDVPH